jgi:hypothetical protein
MTLMSVLLMFSSDEPGFIGIALALSGIVWLAFFMFTYALGYGVLGFYFAFRASRLDSQLKELSESEQLTPLEGAVIGNIVQDKPHNRQTINRSCRMLVYQALIVAFVSMAINSCLIYLYVIRSGFFEVISTGPSFVIGVILLFVMASAGNWALKIDKRYMLQLKFFVVLALTMLWSVFAIVLLSWRDISQ